MSKLLSKFFRYTIKIPKQVKLQRKKVESILEYLFVVKQIVNCSICFVSDVDL